MNDMKEFDLIKTYDNDMEMAKDTNGSVHRFRVRDTNEMVFVTLTFNEWMERMWTDFGSDYLSITLDDGRQADDMGIVREKSNDVHGTWPMTSYACGVHADEVPGRMVADREAGVPTEYSRDGDPVFTSAGHRNKYLNMRGIHDRNAGYRN
jgi:hypothetical protein